MTDVETRIAKLVQAIDELKPAIAPDSSGIGLHLRAVSRERTVADFAEEIPTVSTDDASAASIEVGGAAGLEMRCVRRNALRGLSCGSHSPMV